jgi:hypothetical protein
MTDVNLTHATVGDEAFALQKNVTRPYPGLQITNNKPESIYNYMHS